MHLAALLPAVAVENYTVYCTLNSTGKQRTEKPVNLLEKKFQKTVSFVMPFVFANLKQYPVC